MKFNARARQFHAKISYNFCFRFFGAVIAVSKFPWEIGAGRWIRDQRTLAPILAAQHPHTALGKTLKSIEKCQQSSSMDTHTPTNTSSLTQSCSIYIVRSQTTNNYCKKNVVCCSNRKANDCGNYEVRDKHWHADNCQVGAANVLNI